MVFEDGVPAGVWVFISIYLVGLLALGGWFGYVNSKRDVTPKDHFLAGKDMGILVAVLSLFASSWSGYNIVGAPGESWSRGWYFLRRYPGNWLYAAFTGWMAPRIHFYAHRRDYEGTADFIADRYRNHILSICAVTFSIIPVLLYIMGQLQGVGITMSSMTGGLLTPFASAAIFICVMLFYEMLGGMKAIALTDVVQALILIFGWMSYFIVGPSLFKSTVETTNEFLTCAALYDNDALYRLGEMYLDTRGITAQEYLAGLTEAPAVANTKWWNIKKSEDEVKKWFKDYKKVLEDTEIVYHATDEPVKGVTLMPFTPTDSEWAEKNKGTEQESVYLPMEEGEACDLIPGHVNGPATAKDHVTIDHERLNGWYGYAIGSIAFLIYPHIMDRYYASRNVKVMRSAVMFIHFAIWLAIPSGLIGFWTSAQPGLTNIDPSNKVFATYLQEIIESNWFMYIIGCMIFSAAFAAYMSTADSGMMGFSSAISLDIAKFYIPYFNDDSDKMVQNKRLVRLGKCTSVIAACLALILSTLESLDIPLTDLYAFQGAFLFQVFPAYFLGFFFRGVCSWGILSGLLSGIIAIIVLNTQYSDEKFGDLPHVVWCVLINLGMILLVEMGLRVAGQHPGFEPQTKKDFLCWGPMEEGYVGWDLSSVGGPANEPFKPWPVTLLSVIAILFAYPWWAPMNDYDVNFVGGVPSWAIMVLFISSSCTVVSMVQCYYFYDDWMTEEDYKKHAEMIEEEAGAEKTADFQKPKETEKAVEMEKTATGDAAGSAGAKATTGTAEL